MIDDIAAYIAFRTTYEFLLSQFEALTFGWLSSSLTWVHGIASGFLALHLTWQGYQLITGNASASAEAQLMQTMRAVIVLALAMGITVGGATLFEWMGGDLVRAVAALVHGGDGNILGEIDRNFGYLQMALSSIDWIQAPTAELQAAKARDMTITALGIGAPGLVGGAMLLTLQIGLSLFVGLGPLFVLCLISPRTRPLFDGWLLHGLSTMFSLATLAVMLEIALPMVGSVAATFWTATWTGANPEGVTSLALQQGGLGLVLTSMIISAPMIAARFFKATLGEFMPLSAFGGAASANSGYEPIPSHAQPRMPDDEFPPTKTHADRVDRARSIASHEDLIKPVQDSRSFLERYPNATASLGPASGRGDSLHESIQADLSVGRHLRTYTASDIKLVLTERIRTPSGGYLERPQFIEPGAPEYEAARAKVGEANLREIANAANALAEKLAERGRQDEIETFNGIKSIAVEINPGLAHRATYSAKAHNGAIYINPEIYSDYSPLKQANRMAHEFRHLMKYNQDLAVTDYAAKHSPAEEDAEEFAKELFGKNSK